MQLQTQCSLREPFFIGGVKIRNRVLMAPMSGVSDRPMRDLAWTHGAGAVVSEMVASSGLVSGSSESARRSERGKADVHIVQLAGREASWMAEAARIAEASGADIVDINMGCPAKKVVGGYSGAALMRDLDLAVALIDATVRAVSVPVTLKMRLGWDRNSLNAAELARRAVACGVQAITVHGRTRDQFYDGNADWDAIGAVRDAVAVPLIANGDGATRTDAQEMLRRSGADAVMIGRAHYGRPWAAGYIAGNCEDCWPDDLSPADYVAAHYEAMLQFYGTAKGVRHARKHLRWYLDGHAPEACSGIRTALLETADPALVHSAIGRAFAGVQRERLVA